MLSAIPTLDKRPEDAFDSTRMTRSQIAFWRRVLRTIPREQAGIEVAISTEPIAVREIMDEELYLEHGVFRRAIALLATPRIATFLRIDNTLVAHALLMPTSNHACGGPPPPPGLGRKIGLVGVYVASGRRGYGFARRCIEPIAEIVRRAVGNRRLCVVADQRVKFWMRRHFDPVPVIPQHRDEDDVDYLDLIRDRFKTRSRAA